MSEPDIMQKLAGVTLEMSEQMSAEQLRLYQELITKKYEMKLAEEAFMAAANLESNEDNRLSKELWTIRQVLEDKELRMSGADAVMLASYHKLLEGDKELDTKRLNLFLQSFGRKPANTTKIVDTLAKKRLMGTQSDGMHSHKTFSLTPSGQDQSQILLNGLSREDSDERLSVVS